MDLDYLRVIADYQFGAGVGVVLLPDGVEFKRTRSGRIRQIHFEGEYLCTLRDNGLFTLGDFGAGRIHSGFDSPFRRVVFGEESVPYLRDGRNGMAKFVVEVDDELRCLDEVVVVGPGDEFIGAGRAELSPGEMMDFDEGVAVKTR